MGFRFSVAGLFVGILIGLTGMGGGSLLAPLLILIFGVPPVWAVSTDLAPKELVGTDVFQAFSP